MTVTAPNTRTPELEHIQDGLLLISRAADQLRRRCATVLGTDRQPVCTIRPGAEIRHEQLDGWWDVLDTHHGNNRVDVTLASYTGDPFVISFDHTDIVTVKVDQ